MLWWDIRKFVEPLESLILDPCGDKGSLSKVNKGSLSKVNKGSLNKVNKGSLSKVNKG